LSNVIAIAASTAFYGNNLALKNDGTVVEWEVRRNSEEATVKSGLSNVVAIATGPNYSLALKKDGTVFGWGDNGDGQATGIPITDASYNSSGLVTINGQILVDVIAIAAGKEFSPALKRDGTVVGWGKNNLHRMDVPAGLNGVVAISAGENFCLAITTNNAVADKFRH
jgi:alpha-tubulin suppressor-like RCC1 family protein